MLGITSYDLPGEFDPRQAVEAAPAPFDGSRDLSLNPIGEDANQILDLLPAQAPGRQTAQHKN